MLTHRGQVFLKLSADKLLVSNDRRLKSDFFLFVWNMFCFWAAQLRLTSDPKIQPAITGKAGKTVAFDFAHHGHALVTLYVQFLCSDWSKFDRWVHAENLCSILKLVYFDSWSWQSFVSTCDVFNCLFPLDVQNEIQLLSRVFCYSWLVCLSGFWLRNASPVKAGNPISDGIVFVFHLAWCVRGLKNLKRFWPSRIVSLSDYCIWCFFFI